MRRRYLTLSCGAAVLAGAVVAASIVTRGDQGPPRPEARGAAGPVVLAFADSRPVGPARGALSAHLDSITAVAPDWARIRPDGLFTYTTIDPFLAGLAGRGAGIVPVVRDPDAVIGVVLADRRRANRLALRLARALDAVGAAGVVLDLPAVPVASRRSYPDFVRLLARLTGRPVYVGVPPIANEADERRHRGFDVRDLARPGILVVGAWQQHADPRRPGPVAALDWYRAVVRHMTGVAPRSRLVFGLPTWGLAWTADGPVRITQAQAYGAVAADDVRRRDGAPVRWRGRRAWVEQDRSVSLKLEVAENARVAGVAVQVHGGEASSIWRLPLLRPSRRSPRAGGEERALRPMLGG